MHWYCVHTKPRKEGAAAAHLRATFGVETYFPRLKQYRTIRRVRRLTSSPLFPRYFFCRFDAGINYRAIRYAPDVIDIVCSGDQPAIVRDEIISELQRWAGDAVDVITIQPTLRAGDVVEIIDGPMRGLHAVILHEKKDRDRVAVLLSMLDYGAQMTISRSQLSRVG